MTTSFIYTLTIISLAFLIATQTTSLPLFDSASVINHEGTLIVTPHINLNSNILPINISLVRHKKHRNTLRPYQQSIKQANDNEGEGEEADASTQPTLPQVTPQGYVFDPCQTNDNCAGERECLRGDQKSYCVRGEQGCFCALPTTPEARKQAEIGPDVFSFMFQLCTSCEDCEFYPNETCLLQWSDEAGTEGLCGSSYTVYEGFFKEPDCDSYPEATQYPPQAQREAFKPENGSSIYYQPSQASDPVALPGFSPTVSPSPPSPSSSPSPSVCIDAKLLSHLRPSQLVFDSHQLADVLCDSHGSCATPGHMVTFHGRAMAMKSYCSKIGGCEHDRILVNSPKFSTALRIKSHSQHLHFTSFAATYETKVEETFLRLLVHMGF